jgi:Major Facilitator Superfamily
VFILPLVAMAAIFWLLGRDAPSTGPRPSVTAGISLFGRGVMPWVLSLFYSLTFGGFVALGIYLPKLLVDLFGFTPTGAGLRAAGFVVLATLARPIGGWLADRIGGSRTLLIVLAIVPLTALVMSLQPELGLFRLAVLATAVLLGIGNGAVFKLVAAYYPDKTGAVTGVVGGGGSRRLLPAVGPRRSARRDRLLRSGVRPPGPVRGRLPARRPILRQQASRGGCHYGYGRKGEVVTRATNPLLRNLQYFRRGEKRSDGHAELSARPGVGVRL